MVGDYWEISNSDDASSSSVEEQMTSSLHSAGTPVEWTDEKHSLYLKSMETSFVDQLYNSLGSKEARMFGSNTKPSQHQKMNVKLPERRPWIKHYTTSPKTQTPEPQTHLVSSNGIVFFSSGSASTMKQMSRESCSQRHQISIRQEVSDQNFVNQGHNGSSKKMKTVLSGSSSTDQVVPLRKPPAT